MFDRRRSRGLLIVPMLLWAAACSDTPNDPLSAADEAQLNFDVAAYAADETIDEYGYGCFQPLNPGGDGI